MQTDFRQVLRPILQAHLRLSDAALAQVLPQAPARWSQASRLLRA